MSPEAVFGAHNGFLLLICGLFSLIDVSNSQLLASDLLRIILTSKPPLPFGWAQQRSSKPDEFNCPEEFGYYPHPTDCTQYFVCVFGGALLESCTGGLMYSHELQTCDWPRNVGCGVSTAASIKNDKAVNLATSNPSQVGIRHTTPSWRQQEPYEHHRNGEIPDRHLYEEEDLGPAEEVESDRQQRVYRGQPPTLGQVARDRDGIIRHANALQTSGGLEKVKPISVISFGSHHQPLSKGNSTDSLHSETHEGTNITYDTNRIKRDLTTRSVRQVESKTMVNGTGGYALRFRPAQTETVNDSPLPHVNRSSSFTSSPQFTTVAPRPFPVPSYHTSYPLQRVPLNLLTSGSSNVNSYSNGGHAATASPVVDSSMIVTDYSIVNVAPKPQRHTRFPQPLAAAPLPPSSHLMPQHQDSNMLYQYHRPPPLPPAAALPYGDYRRTYYPQPVLLPPFYPAAPPPSPYYHHYDRPDVSLVTLSYPQSKSQPSHTKVLGLGSDQSAKNVTQSTSEPDKKEETTSTTAKPSPSAGTREKAKKQKADPDDEEFERDEEDDENGRIEGDEMEEEPDGDEFAKLEGEKVEDISAEVTKNTTNAKSNEEKSGGKPVASEHRQEVEVGQSSKRGNRTRGSEEEEESETDEVEKNENMEEEGDGDDDKGGDTVDTAYEDNESFVEEEEEFMDDDKKPKRIVRPATSYYIHYGKDSVPFKNAEFDLNSLLAEAEVARKEVQARKRKRRPKAGFNDTEGDATRDLTVAASNAVKQTARVEPTGTNKMISSEPISNRQENRIVRKYVRIPVPSTIRFRSRPMPVKYPIANTRLVPLALMHSYKPANFSYPHRRFKFGTKSMFENDRLNFPLLEDDDEENFPKYEHPSLLDEIDSHSTTPSTADDEETSSDDDRPNEEEGGKENEEDYDDYAANYDEEQPLLDAVTPLVPNRIKNIDNEVFPSKNDEGDEEEETTADEEDEPNANEQQNEENDGVDEENQTNSDNPEEEEDEANRNNDEEETVSASRNLRKPSSPPGSRYPSTADQIMTPHRQNKYLQNPSNQPFNYNYLQQQPNKSSYSPLPPKPTGTLRSSQTTSKLTNPTQSADWSTSKNVSGTSLNRGLTATATDGKQSGPFKSTANVSKKINLVDSNYNNKKLPSPPSLSGISLRPNFPNHYPSFTHELITYRNDTNGKPFAHNYHHYDNSNTNKLLTANGYRTQQPSKSQRPLSSVPFYLVDESSVPTTSKSIYNITKIEPYYNVYDENSEIYRNIDVDHYHKQRKPQPDYHLIQEPHRLQPQSSQSLNNPIYANQDYRIQSNIDDDGQHSDKLLSNKFFVDGYVDASVKHPTERSPTTFPYIITKTNGYNRPPSVVTLTDEADDNRSKFAFHPPKNASSSSLKLAVDKRKPNSGAEYESVRSYELELVRPTTAADDTFVDETSNTPKLSSYLRKQTPSFVPITSKPLKLTTLPKPNSGGDNLSFRGNFRIIVEPVASKNGTNSSSTTAAAPLKNSQPFANAASDKKTFHTIKPPSVDKFYSVYRPKSTTIYTPYDKISTTAPTTTATSPVAGGNTKTNNSIDDRLLYNRRFYIPKTNTLERKLNFNLVPPPPSPIQPAWSSSTTTTSLPTIPRTDSTVKSTRKSETISTTVEPSDNDNELLYYDEEDDDYEDIETGEDDDNSYLDNKIVDYSPPANNANRNNEPFKTSTKSVTSTTSATPKATNSVTSHHSNVIRTTTQHHHHQPQQQQLHKTSPAAQNPYEYVRKTEASTKRTTERPKEAQNSERSQYNDKSSVRNRNRGSVTYTTGGNEYEAVASPGGRTRPTLKPSTSIVTKNTEAVDIYRHAPRRPDPVYPTPQADKVAAKCRKDICLLPDCSCGGKDIPGDLTPEETPQLVLLTFDDSVNELNRGLYVDLFEKGRVNPNGCPISATFYVSHEWTDYSMVQNLYAAGHEIASHSVSHSFGEQFSQRKWTKEIVGQREILSAYGGVRQEDIRGMRAPFLAVGGNKMFKMLHDANFTYDSSMPIYENRPPSWPYTLDYKLFHDCMIPPCPTRSYPGVWEIPMVMWQDLNGGRCSMGDACSNPPNADGVYKMLIKNFERHFTTNRAPFGLFYHSSWFTQPHHKEGFIAFLDTIVNMPEVWLVTNWQVIQWARDPTPISRLNNFSPFNCDYPERPKRCNNPKVCNLWHKSGVRYLKTCQACPDVYPWTGKTGVRNSRVDNDETPVTE